MSDTPLDRAIFGAVKCTICGAAFGKCDCWVQCSCGHQFERGKKCTNPIHTGGGEKKILRATHVGKLKL